MLREGVSEALVWHPDETVSIWRELRGLGVFFISIEDLRNGLTLVWS
jgi:hypothetical protein